MTDCSVHTFCLSHPYLVLMRSHSEVIKSAIDFMIARVCTNERPQSHTSLSNTCFRKRKDMLSWKPLIYSTACIVQSDKGCVIYPTHIYRAPGLMQSILLCLDLFKEVIFFTILYLWSHMHRFVTNSHVNWSCSHPSHRQNITFARQGPLRTWIILHKC